MASAQVQCGPAKFMFASAICHSSLSRGLDDASTEALNELAAIRRFVARGQVLYHAGDDFSALYVVCAGAFKSSLLSEDGREQIVGFYMAGDVLGADAIGSGTHETTVTSLEDSYACEIPFARLEALCCSLPALHRQLLRVIATEIHHDQNMLLLLGSMRAEERLAAFLLSLSRQFAARGYSHRQYNLPMTRTDIASYLGLTHETVSRLLSRLQQQHVLRIDRRSIELKDISALQSVVGITKSGHNRAVFV